MKKKNECLPAEKVAALIRGWIDDENRPDNGSFAKLSLKNNAIVPEFL